MNSPTFSEPPSHAAIQYQYVPTRENMQAAIPVFPMGLLLIPECHMTDRLKGRWLIPSNRAFVVIIG
jgi:hypothetical protein